MSPVTDNALPAPCDLSSKGITHRCERCDLIITIAPLPKKDKEA